jgi:hypothetical protein
MATFADAISSMDDNEPEIDNIADVIEVLLLEANQVAKDGDHYEASVMAKKASDMAYQTGDIELAVKASCEAHRYNARVRSMTSFREGYNEFHKLVTTQWLLGCNPEQIDRIMTLLDRLELFGRGFYGDQDLPSA